MNIFKHVKTVVDRAIADLAAQHRLPAGLDTARVAVEAPRQDGHGDIATNAAMVLARPAGMRPRDLAALLAAALEGRGPVASAAVAGPGFVNMRLAESFWRDRLAAMLRAGPGWGESEIGAGRPVNVEYVSANPTGPLHAAHARGAVVGDALARLLEKTGHEVTREYYINDAGAQVDTLARSVHLRYREALGEAIGAIPAGSYPGEYLKEVGAALAARDGGKWLDRPEAEWLPEFRAFAIDWLMAEIRADLQALGVEIGVFSSERALVTSGRVRQALDELAARGLIYTGTLQPPKGRQLEDWEPRPQTLFRATAFGDDLDRAMRKSDGSWTYFASDVAYHFDKYRRGFAEQIDVWGADHGGYVKRMRAAVQAVTDGAASLDVKICQMVKLLDGGRPVRMSKRAGSFVTLRDVIDSVGRDVIRFIMLTRRNDQPLEFDFARVTEQSRENPVFYVQYAHARCHSVLRHAEAMFPGRPLSAPALAAAGLHRLTGSGELEIIRRLSHWPGVVEGAAEAHEPHRIAFYLQEVAAAFHAFWNRGKDDSSLRFLREDDPELSLARLALVRAVALVIASGLLVIGVEPMRELRA